MPTLKQIHCSIELGPSNIKLPEYGELIRDGYVETFIAVPDINIPFTVHVKTEGYIGPGLAFFVYMDGEYQCNRNRVRLKMPSPGVVPSDYETEFRFRQKEDKTSDGKFLVRDWTFAKLDRVKADKAPQCTPQFIGNVGTIEVVVLRCQTDPLDPPPRLMLGRAREVEATPTKRDKKAPSVREKREPSVHEPVSDFGGMFGLFDGACDDVGFEDAGRGGPESPGGDEPPQTPPQDLEWDSIMGEYRPASQMIGHNGGFEPSPEVLKLPKSQQPEPQQLDGHGRFIHQGVTYEGGYGRGNAQQGGARKVTFEAGIARAPILRKSLNLDDLIHRFLDVLTGDSPYPLTKQGVFRFANDIAEYRQALWGVQKNNPGGWATHKQHFPPIGQLVAQYDMMKAEFISATGYDDEPLPNMADLEERCLKKIVKPVCQDFEYPEREFKQPKQLETLLQNDLLIEFPIKNKFMNLDHNLPFRLKECLKDIEEMRNNVCRLDAPHVMKNLGAQQCAMLNDKTLRKPIYNTALSIKAYLKDIESRRENLVSFIPVVKFESKKYHGEVRQNAVHYVEDRLLQLDRVEELFKHQLQLIAVDGHGDERQIVHFQWVDLVPRYHNEPRFEELNPYAWTDGAYDNYLRGPPAQTIQVPNNAGWQQVGQGTANLAVPPQQPTYVVGQGGYGQAMMQSYHPGNNDPVVLGPAAYQGYHLMPQQFQGAPVAAGVLQGGGQWVAGQNPYANAQFVPAMQYQDTHAQNVAVNPQYGHGQGQNVHRGFKKAARWDDEGQSGLNKPGKSNKGMGPTYSEERRQKKERKEKEKEAEKKKLVQKPAQLNIVPGLNNPNFLANCSEPSSTNYSSGPSKSSNQWEARGGDANQNNDRWPSPENNNNNNLGAWNNMSKQGPGWSKDNKQGAGDHGWENNVNQNDGVDGWGDNNANQAAPWNGDNNQRSADADWGKTGNEHGGWTGNDNAGGGNNNRWDNTSQAKSNKTVSAGGWGASPPQDTRPQRRKESADPKSHIKPYWQNWNKPPADEESSGAKRQATPRDAYKYPALPRPAVPSNEAKDKSHAVHAGKGADYSHKCRRPEYMDSMAQPYAVFAFKYRSKEALKKILKVPGEDEIDLKKIEYQIEYDKLSRKPKDSVVAELARLRMGLDRQSHAGSASKNANNGWQNEGTGVVNNDQWGAASGKSSNRGGNDWDNRSKKSSNRTGGWKNAAQDDNGWAYGIQNAAAPNGGWANTGQWDGANNNFADEADKTKHDESNDKKASVWDIPQANDQNHKNAYNWDDTKNNGQDDKNAGGWNMPNAGGWKEDTPEGWVDGKQKKTEKPKKKAVQSPGFVDPNAGGWNNATPEGWVDGKQNKAEKPKKKVVQSPGLADAHPKEPNWASKANPWAKVLEQSAKAEQESYQHFEDDGPMIVIGGGGPDNPDNWKQSPVRNPIKQSVNLTGPYF